MSQQRKTFTGQTHTFQVLLPRVDSEEYRGQRGSHRAELGFVKDVQTREPQDVKVTLQQQIKERVDILVALPSALCAA
jgi:hypothetical protein